MIRLRSSTLLALVCWFVWLSPVFAAPARTTTGPAPAWVVPAAGELEPTSTNPEATTAGLDYLLIDRQLRLDERASYQRTAYRVTASAGLQSAAEISIEYDPGYESLELHHVRVVRGGAASDRLDLDAFETMRLERDRERYLYDGRMTAVLHLSDIRVGDVVDFAYTRRGANPVFGDGTFYALSLGWSLPVQHVHYRVHQPAGHPLQIRSIGPAAPERTQETVPDGIVHRWEQRLLPAVRADAAAPEWHVTYPFVQLSSFSRWAEVADWAVPLYSPPSTLTPELQAVVDEVRRQHASLDGRVLAALTFVQEEIRYLGIELGQGSHRPRPPAETLANRFGDCKDKTLLLCTLLQALGVDAAPALVSTTHGPALAEWLPSPLAFDHVIACVDLPGGRHWLDPTWTQQRGGLADRGAPDYGHAFIIRPGEQALTRMSQPADSAGRILEEAYFHSRSFEEPAKVSITTWYSGNRAAGMRRYLAQRDAAEVLRDYTSFLARSYPGVTPDGPLEVTEETAEPRLRVIERYRVPELWVKQDEGGLAAEFYPLTLQSYLAKPEHSVREAPLALAHPVDVTVRMTVELPDDWTVTAEDDAVETAHFAFNSQIRLPQPRRLELSYRYRSKTDHVPAAALADHLASLSKARDLLGYTLTHRPGAGSTDAPAGINPWSLASIGVGLVAGVLAGAWLLRRPRSRPFEAATPGDQPPILVPAPALPLGGWLILVAIGVGIGPLLYVGTIASNAEGYFDHATWQTLQAGEPSHRSLAWLAQAELASLVALTVFSLFAAVLFFGRRRRAPTAMIILLTANAVLGLAGVIGLSSLTAESLEADGIRDAVGAVARACIWVPYFVVSRRVKRTFVL